MVVLGFRFFLAQEPTLGHHGARPNHSPLGPAVRFCSSASLPASLENRKRKQISLSFSTQTLDSNSCHTGYSTLTPASWAFRLLFRTLTIVNWRRSHIIPVFIYGHILFWRHDISRSDQSKHCLHAVSAKHSVCLHVSRAVSRLWPSDVRGIVWHWTLIG